MFALAGIAALWRRALVADETIAGRARALVGWMLVGWGAFSVVGGIVNHDLLTIPDVREGAHATTWDLGFLASGVLLVGSGWFLARSLARKHRRVAGVTV